MGNPSRLPLPLHLRAVAHEAIEDAMLGMPDRDQRAYRRLLTEEAVTGRVDGTALPAARAMERFFDELAQEGQS